MPFDLNNALSIALAGLSEAQKIAPEVAAGSNDHIQQASDIVTGAATVASQVITDPTEQKEAALAYVGASAILSIFSAFKKKK